MAAASLAKNAVISLLVEAEPVEDRVQVAQERVELRRAAGAARRGSPRVAGQARLRDASISGSRSRKSALQVGRQRLRARSASATARAPPGRSCVTSGFVFSANARQAHRACVATRRRKVGQDAEGVLRAPGRARRSSRRRGSSSMIRSRSWPWRSVSAPKTSPVLRTRRRTSPSSSSRISQDAWSCPRRTARGCRARR